MDRRYFVYILASRRNGTLYVGMTNDLIKRVHEHKQGLIPGFTKKYRVTILVHYEVFEFVWDAIHRETRLKKWKREWKINLIQQTNLEWDDLFQSFAEEW
jgi:putative endonuclease